MTACDTRCSAIGSTGAQVGKLPVGSSDAPRYRGKMLIAEDLLLQFNVAVATTRVLSSASALSGHDVM